VKSPAGGSRFEGYPTLIVHPWNLRKTIDKRFTISWTFSTVVTGTARNIAESYVESDPTRFEQNLNSIHDLIA
jgi:hypothetical protein